MKPGQTLRANAYPLRHPTGTSSILSSVRLYRVVQNNANESELEECVPLVRVEREADERMGAPKGSPFALSSLQYCLQYACLALYKQMSMRASSKSVFRSHTVHSAHRALLIVVGTENLARLELSSHRRPRILMIVGAVHRRSSIANREAFGAPHARGLVRLTLNTHERKPHRARTHWHLFCAPRDRPTRRQHLRDAKRNLS